MNVRQAYDQWSEQYDTNINKTRDLEAVSLRDTLALRRFNRILEIGCGTGKNTQWLQTVAEKIVAVDLSDEMLAVAKNKVAADKAVFIQADITAPWEFAAEKFDLISFSLVLEHIEHLTPIFEKAMTVLASGGLIYIGELHPFKQYSGTKARFETERSTEIVTCFNHNVSDFTSAAAAVKLNILIVSEYFDDNNRQNIPRILTLLLKKAE